MNNFNQIEEIATELTTRFEAYAAHHGITEVILKSTEIRGRYGCSGYISAQALREAGFTLGKDVRWRRIFGVNRLEFGGESTLDEVMD
jgi:hypothetical protein